MLQALTFCNTSVTLTFTGTVSDGPIRRQGHGSVCFVYAIIKEEAIGSTMTLCAGDVRRKHVYTTSTNSVEIRIVTKKREGEEPSYFMIDYEGTYST